MKVHGPQLRDKFFSDFTFRVSVPDCRYHSDYSNVTGRLLRRPAHSSRFFGPDAQFPGVDATWDALQPVGSTTKVPNPQRQHQVPFSSSSHKDSRVGTS